MNLTNERYDEMIRSYLDGQCSQEEASALLSWVAESDENRDYFEAFQEVWSLTDFTLEEDDNDVESALKSVNAKIDAVEAETKTVKMPWIRRNFKYVSAAAAVVVALFLGFLVSKPFDSMVTVAYDSTNPSRCTSCPTVARSPSKAWAKLAILSSLPTADVMSVLKARPSSMWPKTPTVPSSSTAMALTWKCWAPNSCFKQAKNLIPSTFIQDRFA